MALVGAAVTFRLTNFYQGALATALKEELVSVSKEIELAAGQCPMSENDPKWTFGYDQLCAQCLRT